MTPFPKLTAMSLTNAVKQAADLLRGVAVELERELPAGTRVTLSLVVGTADRLDVALTHEHTAAGIASLGNYRFPLAALDMTVVLEWCREKAQP